MKQILIWTNGYHYQNTRSFLFPFITFKDYFRSKGIEISFSTRPIKPNRKVYLFIESNFFGKQFTTKPDEIFELLTNIRSSVYKIIYFDLSDSSSILHPDVINYVDLYCKGQMLKDKNLYKREFYGNRIFSDFIFKKFNVQDKNVSFSKSLKQSEINKLKVHWNSGVGNYTLTGRIMDRLYELYPIRKFLFYPKYKYINFKDKKNDLFYNMNLYYSRNSISWYRKQAFINLKIQEPNRINILKYFKKLKNSRISISPFGWGEINYRDYESIIYGSVLLKPKMSHIDTWPNLYKSGLFTSYRWDCSDLKVKLEDLLRNYSKYQVIAKRANKFYLDFLNPSLLRKSIFKRLKELLS